MEYSSGCSRCWWGDGRVDRDRGWGRGVGPAAAFKHWDACKPWDALQAAAADSCSADRSRRQFVLRPHAPACGRPGGAAVAGMQAQLAPFAGAPPRSGLTAIVGGCITSGFSKRFCGGSWMKPLPTTGVCEWGHGVGAFSAQWRRSAAACAARLRALRSARHARERTRPPSAAAAGRWRSTPPQATGRQIWGLATPGHACRRRRGCSRPAE